MSQIEEKAKHVLIPLMLGQRISIGISEIETIKNWIVLKTIIGEYDDPNAITISKEALEAFFSKRELINDWKIWIARYCGKEWITRRRHSTFCIDTKANIPTPGLVKINTQSTTMVGGQLFMMAISTSSEHLANMDLRRAFGDVLFQIHPSIADHNNWPPKGMIGDDLVEFLANILNELNKNR